MSLDSQTHSSLLDGLHDTANHLAWQRFHDRYQPLLLAFAKRIGLNDDDARELVAETLACFVEQYPNGFYEREKGRLRDWLKGVLRNFAHRQWQKRQIEARHAPAVLRESRSATGGGTLGGHGDGEWGEHDVDEAYEREWRLDLLDQALTLLRRESNIDAFQAFDLSARKGCPAAEVAAHLNMNVNAVYVAKHRMLKRLGEIARELEKEQNGGRDE